jgi:hypothetical protein
MVPVIERADGAAFEQRVEMLGHDAHTVVRVDIDRDDMAALAGIAGAKIDPPEALRERQYGWQLGMGGPPRMAGLDGDQLTLAPPQSACHRNRRRLSRALE